MVSHRGDARPWSRTAAAPPDFPHSGSPSDTRIPPRSTSGAEPSRSLHDPAPRQDQTQAGEGNP